MKTKALISIGTLVSILILSLGFRSFIKRNDPSGFVLVPSGSTVINGKTYSFNSFYIEDHEVSNLEYNNFLNDLKRTGRDSDYAVAVIHSENWLASEYLSSYAQLYNLHQVYENFPVVNISYEAAKLYCSWLTTKLKDKSQEYRLPSKTEWIYAAKGGLELSSYSWSGCFLRNKKGEFMCNFHNIGDELIHTNSNNRIGIIKDGKFNGNHLHPLPVNSFSHNFFGLYNMNGNVAEMVEQKGIAVGGSWNSTGYDVRIESEITYEEPSIYIGFRPVKSKKSE